MLISLDNLCAGDCLIRHCAALKRRFNLELVHEAKARCGLTAAGLTESAVKAAHRKSACPGWLWKHSHKSASTNALDDILHSIDRFI